MSSAMFRLTRQSLRHARTPHRSLASVSRSLTTCIRPNPSSSSSAFLSSSRLSSLAASRSSLPPRRTLSTVQDSSWLNGTNAAYADEMYLAWKDNPESVHKSWDAYFKTGQYTAPPGLYEQYTPLTKEAAPSSGGSGGQQQQRQQSTTPQGDVVDAAKVVQLARAFQVRGHLLANLDPLGILPPRPEHEDLSLTTYGLSDADLQRPVDLSGLQADVKGFIDRGRGRVTLQQIYTRLRETYCGTIGYEYMHIPSIEKCNWIREKIETRERMVFTRQAKLQILDRLTWADHFERFIQKKHGSAKRFGLEGAESFIAGMKSLIGRSAELSVDNIVIGMPHRGRLNVLNTVVRKNTAQIFAEFADTQEDEPDSGHGDVKYHLGMSFDQKAGRDKDKTIHLTLMANPSHLEAVDPVVLGKTKAKQFYANDRDGDRSMGLLLHGDAAFAGQGVVYETMGLMHLDGYSTGGTVHMVVNNQVGFTTDPVQGRSTPYCTDIAKAFNLPVFHVNGDDPEAVVHVCELAAEWRARYKTDVVIDLVCYRKYGHNEIDEPSFTQPLMYAKIANMPSALDKYQAKLKEEGITADEIKAISDKVNSLLNKAFEESTQLKHATKDWFRGSWKGLVSSKDYSPPQKTGVPVDTLRDIGLKVSRPPEGFHTHPRLATVYKAREKSIAEGKNIDWGTAEALAFGSLLLDGKHVRLSGQDVERGTFSHRHSVLHDQKTNDSYVPLNNIAPGKQAHFTVVNSSLSEYGVLGFELGYSLENPTALVMWEAQFGDFFNTAQVIVDQFISSGEDKWQRQTGLVMLLPHGYEGAGPEHSSARIERFLQQTNDNPAVIPTEEQSKQIQHANWQCVNCSTPANYFHVLRRQLMRDFRKPLVVFTPKMLLRFDKAKSALEEMGEGSKFMKVYGEVDAEVRAAADKVTRVLMCSGKVYYDLARARAERKLTSVAILRIEQLAPFPYHALAAELKQYAGAAELVWVQEEPMNMGAWTYVKDRIESAAVLLCGRPEGERVRYVGRPPSASTAAGHASQHNKELKAMLEQVYEGL